MDKVQFLMRGQRVAQLRRVRRHGEAVAMRDAACRLDWRRRYTATREVNAMTKVERIERQIEGLSGTEFAELREWVLERD